MKIRLSLRAQKHIGKKVKYDWEAFSTMPDLQENYELEVRNRFKLLHEHGEAEQKVVPVRKKEMRHDMRFPTMWHFDKCRLRRACAASFFKLRNSK